MVSTLIVGYGNPDRQDDGVAWHILVGLALHLGRGIPSWPDEYFEPGGDEPDLMFMLQLTPELAEVISKYQRVCFIDAHTGKIPQDLNVTSLDPVFQNSPLTHHLTPQSCLSLADTLYHVRPESILVSVRGYQFGFDQALSEKTSGLVPLAIEKIIEWLAHN